MDANNDPAKQAALVEIREQAKGTASRAQCDRLLTALRRFPVTTFEAMRFLDVYHVPACVLQLRKLGHAIDTHWLAMGSDTMAANHDEPGRQKATYAKALQDFDRLPDSASVRLPVVAALHGISTVAVWRWSKSGRLPQPIKRGGVTTWRVGDLRQTMAETA